ncbi:hypothetical protein GCM10010260_64170 [Streptomyces filipinensis]|uniref:Uncharacterized protein n=1 Tax=Streptomyces filipinensis TaxID=66887 RepID=A0A918IH65_9ACTN|nr:hypothetical protein GCM10010260_64170 [Streptomyces filipinensis]
MKETPTGRRSDAPITGSSEEVRHNHGKTVMVTPLGEESSDSPVPPAPWRYCAVWDCTEGRIADARRVGGHGLRLITRLCDRLHTVDPGTGKQVVAHLPLHRSGD